jgi:hypothetical protein
MLGVERAAVKARLAGLIRRKFFQRHDLRRLAFSLRKSTTDESLITVRRRAPSSRVVHVSRILLMVVWAG